MNYDKTVSEMLNVDGALAAAIVDFSSGMLLAGGGSAAIDLEIAAAGNTEVMRAKNENHANVRFKRHYWRHLDYFG